MSTLLEQASLVMIPSGYKEDVVYSQIPTSGAGDLSFTRASNGTRINSVGLVEVCPWNLFTYSEDFANADWTKVGSTISSNVLVAPNGTTTADKLVEDTSNGVHIALQISGERNVNSIYAFSVYAKAGERTKINLFNNGNGLGNANFDLSNGTATLIAGEFATIESVGNGWYRCVVGMQENSTVGNFNYHIRLLDASGSDSYTGNGTSGAYIWGAQVNLGTAKPYFPTTDRLNVPRLTYQNGGGGCPSLLLEKQSTNLCTYSEQLDNSAWTKNNTSITANSVTSPDGTQNADTITSTAASPNTLSPLASFAATTNVSIFVKYVSQQWVQLMSGGAFNAYANFDIQNGVIGTVGSNASNAQIENFGNGWYRISVNLLGFTGNTNLYFGFVANGTAGWNTFDPNFNKSLYAWGCQIEVGAYPTSYIPTTSSSATRVLDECSKTGISSLIGQTEGVLFVDFVFTAYDYDPKWVAFLGGGASYIGIYTQSTPEFVCEIANSGVPQFFSNTYVFSVGQRYKLAIAYKANDFAFYVNGTQVATDSSGTVPATSQFSLQYNTATANLTSRIYNQVALFKTRLTNAELASLTTI